jgi:Mechanosensitive ion channel
LACLAGAIDPGIATAGKRRSLSQFASGHCSRCPAAAPRRRITVEGISIRSLRLRHHRGAVDTVPYGELKALTNHSRDWVIVKLEFQVTYDTNVLA